VGWKTWTEKPKFWIANKELVEIKFIRIDAFNKFSRTLNCLSRLSLGHVIEIWQECVNRFPKYEWILYNNKRLKQVDLEECVNIYKDNGILYLKSSLRGEENI
jgi:hypothetical protein